MTRSGKRRRRKARSLAVNPNFRLRRLVLLGVLALAGVSLVWRAVDRQVLETDFLQHEGERRFLRVVEMAASRGMITDRRGEPLAISTPVKSVWADPRRLSPDAHTLAPVAKALQLDPDELRRTLAQRSDRGFVYLKRRVNPDMAEKVAALDVKGISLERTYRRFYPSGEVTGHLLGFTDINDVGQEGLELAYEDWLKGTTGAKRVIKDGRDRVVKNVESIRAPAAGKDLVLSIDRRLQFLAYRELKAAVQRHRAKAGTAVLLDVETGEVLAVVNQPAFNPNGLRNTRDGRARNRAVTDVFEPGSTIKPFTVAAGLDLGRFRSDTVIDTSPGWLNVGRHLVKDIRNYGKLDVAQVIQKSSNVGTSKIALDLESEALFDLFSGFGFGNSSNSSFPGEAAGQLPSHREWSRFEQATLAFGYGMSVTALQLAEAYAVLAADGIKRPVSLLRTAKPVAGRRIVSVRTARTVRNMMQAVVSAEGTAPLAAIPGFQVAGKTGTAKKSIAGGYAEDRYISVFAGMAPVSKPRLVMAVVIDEPTAGEYYGGKVAAPVFAKVMAGALRLLNVVPDATPDSALRLAASGGRP